ncbi:unnamed protein product [Acanthoscelides obtectus]|uniref:Uncharacterized protein n=1 Tax=Acanthoscelides obtectus TaxID=200917 RepID=A0A9P0JQ07_ACAOB|nr:unnamed protein product [Acanthoscelides obtectus]CAK1668033.1 hypothetical protein AOBTE_LOCUS26188 [Acanthoscelides obtectus]
MSTPVRKLPLHSATPLPRKQSRDLTWRIRCSLYSEARHKRYCNSIVNIQYSIEFLRDFLVYSGLDIGLKNINNREVRWRRLKNY